MSFLNRKKPVVKIKETSDNVRNYSDSENINNDEKQNENSRIKVLGSGCAKCKALENATIEALKDLNLNLTVEHVTDYAKIASFGVMSTPALVIDEKVVSYGKILKKQEIIEILKKVCQ